MKRLAFLLLAGVAVFVMPDEAVAMPITAASEFIISWSLPYNGSTIAAATATFSAFDFREPHQATFTMNVTNTSTGTSDNDIRFTSFGGDTKPAPSAVSDTTSVYASAVEQSQGPDAVSLCFHAGKNRDGDRDGGLEDSNHTNLHGDPTTTGAFSVTVTFGNSIVPPLDFNNFDGRFQAGGRLGSKEGLGTCTAGCSVTPASEPASAALIGTGLALLGIVRRRKQATPRV